MLAPPTERELRSQDNTTALCCWQGLRARQPVSPAGLPSRRTQLQKSKQRSWSVGRGERPRCWRPPDGAELRSHMTTRLPLLLAVLRR